MTETPRRMATAAVVRYLIDRYPRQTVPEETIRAYVDDLERVDPNALMRAAKRWALTQRWFPTIAELLMGVANERPALPTPHEAWEWALGQARTPDPLPEPLGRWTLAHRAVELVGGYYGISTAPDQYWLGKRFMEAYESFVESEKGAEPDDAPAIGGGSVGEIVGEVAESKRME